MKKAKFSIRHIVLFVLICILVQGSYAQRLILLDHNAGDKRVNDSVITVFTNDISSLELSAHLKILNNTDTAMGIFMKKIINQMVDSTSNYFCLNPKCWPDADSTDIADSIPPHVADSSFVTHYDHYFRYERPIPPGFTSITYLFYDYTTFPQPVEARVTVNYHISGVGIAEDKTRHINVFPVPASRDISVHLDNSGPYTGLLLIDSRGVLLREKKLRAGERSSSMDVSQLPNGFYFVGAIGRENTVSWTKIQVVH